MIEFASIEDFVAFLESRPAAMRAAGADGLTMAAKMVEAGAKEALGTYQGAAGPFPDWEPLAESTMHSRAIWGYGINEPELVTHELREHIGSSVDRDALNAAVGVPSMIVGEHGDPKGDPHTRFRDIGEVAEVQELGLGIPQRSFLGLTMARHSERVVDLMCGPVVRAICGETPRALTSPEAEEIPF